MSTIAGSTEKVLIGIDGGGTKTEFIMFTESGHIISKLKLSRSNPNDIGMDACCEILAEGIDLLLEKEPTVYGIFAGIAGCSTGNNGLLVENYLKQRYPSISVAVDTDGVNVLSCNIQSLDSMALICGTGSVLFVRENGVKHRIGGWGYLFDEAGSAYDVGKDAIRAVLSQMDGMGRKTLLADLLYKELKSDVWEALSEIYQKGKVYIASFAPLVFQAHKAGDRVATEILQDNAARLALLINTAMRHYRCGNHVVACGGLIEHFRESFVPLIEEKLTVNVEFIFPSLPPIYGACVESCRRVGILPDQVFFDTFSSEYLGNN